MHLTQAGLEYVYPFFFQTLPQLQPPTYSCNLPKESLISLTNVNPFPSQEEKGEAGRTCITL